MKTHLSALIWVFLFILLSPLTLSQSWGSVRSENSGEAVQAEYELVCRSKAKEIAAQAYRSCITENKTAEIEKLRKEFQEKLKTLKADYDAEIQRLGGKVKPSTAKNAVRKSQARMKAKSPAVSNAIVEEDGMSVEMKPVVPATQDDSVMDIPDPVPVTE